jgi:PKD repeat protein
MADNLPDGLHIDVNSGLVYGTPTAAGSWNTTLVATNDVNPNATQSCAVVIVAENPQSPPPPSTPPANTAPRVTSGDMPDGRVGVTYRFTVTATGNPAPYYLVRGLPAGLRLSRTTGAVTGTPTTRGTYNVTLIARNGIDPQSTQRQVVVIR